MSNNTEALRAQFEQVIFDVPAPFLMERDGDSYVNRTAAWTWEGYQAGHAAGVAAERERCANLAEAINILVRFAEGLTTHTYSGACPSNESPKSRDPQCMVCWAIDAARSAQGESNGD